MMMVIVVALLGLILGSFLNVVIYRLPRKKSLIHPGSHCTSCNQSISFYDNIPLISYLLLRGRCRKCGVRISWRYPLVELLTALCLAALLSKYGLSFRMLTYGILTLFLIPISFIDLEKGLILNRLTISGFFLGVILVLGLQIENWKEVLEGTIGGGLIGLIIGWIGKTIFRKDSLGMGDVKLLVMIGPYAGFPGIGICLLFGVFVAAFIILGGMVSKKLSIGDTIPFGPFIAIGTLVYFLWGELILDWYLKLI